MGTNTNSHAGAPKQNGNNLTADVSCCRRPAFTIHHFTHPTPADTPYARMC